MHWVITGRLTLKEMPRREANGSVMLKPSSNNWIELARCDDGGGRRRRVQHTFQLLTLQVSRNFWYVHNKKKLRSNFRIVSLRIFPLSCAGCTIQCLPNDIEKGILSTMQIYVPFITLHCSLSPVCKRSKACHQVSQRKILYVLLAHMQSVWIILEMHVFRALESMHSVRFVMLHVFSN